jgi:hypothetical protein
MFDGYIAAGPVCDSLSLKLQLLSRFTLQYSNWRTTLETRRFLILILETLCSELGSYTGLADLAHDSKGDQVVLNSEELAVERPACHRSDVWKRRLWTSSSLSTHAIDQINKLRNRRAGATDGCTVSRREIRCAGCAAPIAGVALPRPVETEN